LAHPFSLAYCLGSLGQFHCFRREEHLAREHAEAAIALASDLGFPFWIATGGIVAGWASTEQGQLEEGIAQMRRGIEARRATGVEIGQPHFLALLAEVCGKMGRSEEGLILLTDALAAADKTGECWYEAELYRLKGELTLQFQVQGPKSKVEEEAEECFQKAIEVAHRQQAKSLELRAVMSLSRLWQQQGKKAEARQMLADVYGWFTEGFDTADLQEAKTLLETLSS
jgi:predicted ATPase